MVEIKGFVPNSLVDWDGKVVSVIFLPSCNFRCSFCSNKELVLEPEKIESIRFETIKKYLEKNRDFVDGVVISGGEPCMHSTLPELCRKIMELGFKVKIDTNGSFPGMLTKLVEEKLVDFVAMDIKNCFEDYEKTVNVKIDIENIKESIRIIAASGIDYEFRITMYPEVSEKELLKIAGYLKENKVNKKFFLQQFRAENCINPEAERLKPYSKQEIEKFLGLLKPYFEKIGLRNV